ncbi:MAG TPA: hypothetical protein VF644_03945 [Pyrinomonadaceae bacterium]|jgi:hypothetical protein
MKRNFFLVSFLAAMVFGSSSLIAFAQQTPPKKPATPDEECAELMKLSDERKGKFTAEQKKAYDEAVSECKKRADVASQNAKVQNEDKLIAATIKEGNAAFSSKNYDLAIAKFDEGYNINQTYIGSAPVFLNNKATALSSRASERLKAAIANNNDKAMKEQAKQDWLNSYEAASKSLQLTKNPPAGASPEEQKTAQQNKYDALVRMTQALRLLTLNKLDTSKSAEIKLAYQEYLTVETDPAKKTVGQMQYADLLRETGECESAAAEYQKILAEKADDADALAGAGLCLFNNGVASDNKDLMQQGMNTLTRFVEVAPDTHKLKESVKSAIEYLKTEQKIAPQKGGKSAAPARKRG